MHLLKFISKAVNSQAIKKTNIVVFSIYYVSISPLYTRFFSFGTLK